MMTSKQERAEAFKQIDLYPVISSEFCNGRNPVDVLKAVADGGAGVVQMREKNLNEPDFMKMAEEFRKITEAFNMLLIINDNVHAASEVGADGVHLGQNDMPLSEAKQIAPDIIIGVSTHSFSEIESAQKDKADYINIGPIFSTATKTLSIQPLGPDFLRKALEIVKVPFTVMGGIKQQHIPELLALNATRIAMVTEITQAENITQRVQQLRKLWPES
jgi:thiamine-phosphate pyrophosphorylase